MPWGGRGYNRIQLMQDQVDILFGQVPESIEDFARLSQISQAEAKKFFIERTRLKKWRRTGVIWWNMLDGWPQISDAVVDYYYAKKLAYYYIKRVQQPIVLMMDELVDWGHQVVLGNDSRETHAVRYQIADGDTGEILLAGDPGQHPGAGGAAKAVSAHLGNRRQAIRQSLHFGLSRL